MWSSLWQNGLMLLCGLSAGTAVACGVFTVFTAVGLVPRFADRINGADHILIFENMIILGVFIGIILSIFGQAAAGFVGRISAAAGCIGRGGENIVSIGQQIIITAYALFTGCYVSCLALSIAEIFDAIPIMARRIRLKKGIGIVICLFAAGKAIGSLFYYIHTFSETMG